MAGNGLDDGTSVIDLSSDQDDRPRSPCVSTRRRSMPEVHENEMFVDVIDLVEDDVALNHAALPEPFPISRLKPPPPKHSHPSKAKKAAEKHQQRVQDALPKAPEKAIKRSTRRGNRKRQWQQTRPGYEQGDRNSNSSTERTSRQHAYPGKARRGADESNGHFENRKWRRLDSAFYQKDTVPPGGFRRDEVQPGHFRSFTTRRSPGHQRPHGHEGSRREAFRGDAHFFPGRRAGCHRRAVWHRTRNGEPSIFFPAPKRVPVDAPRGCSTRRNQQVPQRKNHATRFVQRDHVMRDDERNMRQTTPMSVSRDGRYEQGQIRQNVKIFTPRKGDPRRLEPATAALNEKPSAAEPTPTVATLATLSNLGGQPSHGEISFGKAAEERADAKFGKFHAIDADICHASTVESSTTASSRVVHMNENTEDIPKMVADVMKGQEKDSSPVETTCATESAVPKAGEDAKTRHEDDTCSPADGRSSTEPIVPKTSANVKNAIAIDLTDAESYQRTRPKAAPVRVAPSCRTTKPDPSIHCNFVIIDETSDEETGNTTSASEKNGRSKPRGRPVRTYPPTFDFEKNFNYSMTQEAAAEIQERLLRNAASRVRIHDVPTMSLSQEPQFTAPLFDVHVKYPDHWKWKDPYKCLGLPPKSNITLAKSQYRRLAKFYHPDKSKMSNTATKFHGISTAYKRICEEPR